MNISRAEFLDFLAMACATVALPDLPARVAEGADDDDNRPASESSSQRDLERANTNRY